jgi:hypothetical protein
MIVNPRNWKCKPRWTPSARNPCTWSRAATPHWKRPLALRGLLQRRRCPRTAFRGDLASLGSGPILRRSKEQRQAVAQRFAHVRRPNLSLERAWLSADRRMVVRRGQHVGRALCRVPCGAGPHHRGGVQFPRRSGARSLRRIRNDLRRRRFARPPVPRHRPEPGIRRDGRRGCPSQSGRLIRNSNHPRNCQGPTTPPAECLPSCDRCNLRPFLGGQTCNDLGLCRARGYALESEVVARLYSRCIEGGGGLPRPPATTAAVVADCRRSLQPQLG